MRSTYKILIVFLIIMVTFGLPILLQQVLSPKGGKVQVTPTPIQTSQVDDIRFLSVPPVLVSASSTFMYKIVATSLSGNDVTLSVIAKPDWLSWIAETQQLTGVVPSVGGVFTVTIRAATISGDVQDQTFTVTIDKEADVKGAKTVGLWTDPFHPNLGSLDEKTDPILPAVTESDVNNTDVLGVKTETTAKNFLTDQQQTYLLGALGIILVIVIITIVTKLLKAITFNRSKLPPGITIERGGR